MPTAESAEAVVVEPIPERDIPQGEREKMPAADFAGKGDSFPIRVPADVAAAAASIGRAGADNYSTDQLKANIIRIAKRKGAAFVAQLPKAWRDDDSGEQEAAMPEPNGAKPSKAAMQGEIDAMMAKGMSKADAMAACAKKHGMSPAEMSAMMAAAPLAAAAPAGTGRHTTVILEASTVEAVNRTASTLDVVLIRPGWSLNNRYYPREVLAAAAPKLEGVRAFANHPTKGDRPERSIGDQVGYYSGITVAEDGALRGQLKLVGAGAATEHVLAWAEESISTGQPLMGLSINGVGRTEAGEAEGRKGDLVAEITDFESVDVVTRPAAGGRFEALAASDGGDTLAARLLAAMDYEEWSARSRPEFLAEVRRQITASLPGSDSTVLSEAQARATALEAELTTVRSERDGLARKERAAAAVEHARIPFVYRAALAEQVLAMVPDETHWPLFLAQQAQLLAAQAAAVPVPVVGAGPLAGGSVPQVEYDVPTVAEGETFREWQLRKARRDQREQQRQQQAG